LDQRDSQGAPARAGVAVVGAGVAGLTCARELARRRVPVTLFDKGRAPGGRVCTRREGALGFDHGAQYVTARSEAFASELATWREADVVRMWHGRIACAGPGGHLGDARSLPRYVGVPSMSALAHHLAAGLDVRRGARVTAVGGGPGAHVLWLADGATAGPFEAVVVAAPAPQALPLLEEAAPDLAGKMAGVSMAPCTALMAAFDRPLLLDFDAAFSESPPLAWVARNDSKPGRGWPESWVLHADPDWSTRHAEEPPQALAAALFAAFARLGGPVRPRPVHWDVHRWRYARVTSPAGLPFLLDTGRGVGACGDWCLGARVESAWESGRALGRALAAQLGAGPEPGPPDRVS